MLLDWWQRVTDSPRTRYLAQRRMGATEELALAVVASSYGLNTEVVRLGSDGTEKVITIPWSLDQINGLLFARMLYRSGRLHDD